MKGDVFIYPLSTLTKIFTNTDYSIFICDEKLNVIDKNENFDNLNITIVDTVDKYFINNNFVKFLNKMENSNSATKFNCVKFNFDSNIISTLVFKVSSTAKNTKNAKYFFVVNDDTESNNAFKFDNTLDSNNLIQIYEHLSILNNKINNEDVDFNNYTIHINDMAKLCFASLKNHEAINIYSSLINNACEFSIVNSNISNFLLACTKRIQILAKDSESLNQYNIKCVTTTADKNIWVRFDLQMLQLAINEIISNACEFCVDQFDITVTLKNDDKNAYIIVSDTGLGFHNSILKTAFNPHTTFYYDNINKFAKGYGLGLPIALEIIKALDGDITLKNNKTKGASVTISLPLSDEQQSFQTLSTPKLPKIPQDKFSYSKITFANIFDLYLF